MPQCRHVITTRPIIVSALNLSPVHAPAEVAAGVPALALAAPEFAQNSFITHHSEQGLTRQVMPCKSQRLELRLSNETNQALGFPLAH